MRFGALACVAFAACSGGDPVNGLCARIGASGCTMDGRATFTCDARGYVETACADGQQCVAAECRSRTCTASLFYCDHEVARVCDASGTIERVTDCGTMHARCVVGPDTASCVPSVCAPLTTFCSADGATLEKCAPDGMSSSTVQTCDDPLQRGNRCVGSACRDRCALTEAGDRSTLGCRFVGAALAGGSPTLVLANPQPDLPAQVTLTPATGAPRSVTVSPGGSAILAIDAAAPVADGASIAKRASAIQSSVPIQAWIYESGADGLSLHPEHALSTSYLVASLFAGRQQVVALATVNNTQVTLTTAAGTPYTGTLARGQALTVSSTTNLTAARIAASAPIAVEVLAGGGEASLPGADTLGQDFVVLRSCVAVARDAATVTSSSNGTSTIAAGATLTLSGPERVQSTAPLLIVDQTSGLEVVPPVEQWLAKSFAPPGPTTLLLAATQPAIVNAGAATVALTAGPTAGWATGSTAAGAALPLSAASPFYAFVTDGKSITVPAGYGLASIHP